MLNFTSLQLWLALLILARLATTLAVFPLFNGQYVPAPLKIGLATILTIVLYPLVPKTGIVLPDNLLEAAMAVSTEVVFGLLFGFVAHLIFLAVQFAGQFIDIQIGLGLANVIDPALDPQMTVLGKFHYLLAILIFLTVSAHHWLLEALARSFQIIPLGGLHWSDTLAKGLIALSGEVFTIAVKIAAPIIITSILTNLAMGILGRVIPQINLFAVGFPVIIASGLLVLAFSLPLIAKVMKGLFIDLPGKLVAIINLMQ